MIMSMPWGNCDMIDGERQFALNGSRLSQWEVASEDRRSG